MSPSNAGRTVYAVSEVAELLRALIEDSLPGLWIEGEISNLARPASGHWYFTLKDARAQIRCAMFRNANFLVKPPPKDGDAVLVRARASVYPARGDLQLIVEHMEPAGTGALLRAFEELKARLAAEGLFDAALKRALPVAPRRIGLITSATGAAIHDVLTVLQRRWPLAEVLLYPVPVQGSEAPPAIVRALAELPRRAPVDVVLLVRGGGSLEDLWSFNDERVARAIRACTEPVVCGVGHEIDVTIADFSADLRAATPTAAAELATPDIADWQRHAERLGGRLVEIARLRIDGLKRGIDVLEVRLQRQNPVERRFRDWAQRVDELGLRLAAAAHLVLRDRRLRLDHAGLRIKTAHPQLRIAGHARRSAELDSRLQRAVSNVLARAKAGLERPSALLLALSPRAVLDRGYAIALTPDGRALRSSAEAAPGDTFRLHLARGSLVAEVRSTDE